MDLFTPAIEFNYEITNKEMEFDKLDNPYIKVIWEDSAENFTQEKLRSVKNYFQKKYNTTNVSLITKTKVADDVTHNVDISFNILDKNYQVELIKLFLKSKSNEDKIEEILKIDSIVDNKLTLSDNEVIPFKKWYIKKIEFSNFLSYGENQKLDFNKCDGISVVESNPPNFGGKTVLTVDLLLFLFFNETTKTSKAEEIFNRFTDKNKVHVRGDVLIDGDEYIIVRNLERKKSKSGEWNVKTELDFFKKLSDGSLQNFTGEQRRETENFIKNSIGSKEDFLMTILTTATNLEDLVDSKPTARGQVLSRFMGLDFLKKKEETAKEIYSEFSKSMISNVYNSEQLKSDNETFNQNISNLKENNKELEVKLNDVKDRIVKGKEYKDGLTNKKFTDIDKELVLLQPSKVEEEIEGLEIQKSGVEKQLKEIKVIEPSEFYYEDKHDTVKEQYQEELKKKIEVETTVREIEKLKSSVSGGIKCEHCGIELLNASITQTKISELDGLLQHKTEIETLMTELSNKEKGFVQLKKEFDEYEKNKLIKEKYLLSIESFDLKISNNNNFQIENLTEKIQQNLNKIVKILEESEKEKIYKLYLEIFGKNGITKLIMKTMMPLINSELQRLMEDSAHFKLEVRINEKNEVEFIMIDNNTQIEKLMVSGSGYERTIASLALRAVLSKICSLPKPNIVVFDEVFGKISNDNLDMVSDFFTKIKDYFEKVFVITHNPLVTNWADNVIKIKKENNISYVSQ